MSLSDFFLGCVVWAVMAAICAIIWSRKPTPPVVSKDEDAEAAIDTLMGMGYTQLEAETRVFEARRNNHDADFEELVNIAVKN